MSTTVGFTGTRKALTRSQVAELDGVLMSPGPRVLHHGDCIGADATAHAHAVRHGLEIHVWPPSVPFLRAWCPADTLHPELPYLERNRAIVDASDWLLAMPNTFGPRSGSGTWYTIDHAAKRGKHVVVVYPDGQIVEFNQ